MRGKRLHSRKYCAPWFCLAWMLAAHSPASGQISQLYLKEGGAQNAEYGFAVAGAGDANGDGRDDFIVSAAWADSGALDAGAVFVYSGADGSVLHAIYGTAQYEKFGWSVAGVGDRDLDGCSDFIVAAPTFIDPGRAIAYSGATGAILYEKPGPPAGPGVSAVSGAGDVDGDGIPDFIIGSPSARPGGRLGAGSAIVYSGADGGLLYQKDGSEAGDALGVSVAGLGDINGDGRSDFVVGAHGTDVGGQSNAGTAYVYSGIDGGVLFEVSGALRNSLGFSVAGSGDLNGDGVPDFLIGVPNNPVGDSLEAGTVVAYSGATGAVLHVKDGVALGEHLGYAVGGAGDVDGDGRADFIAGAPSPHAGTVSGTVFVYSGATGQVIFQMTGTAGDKLGWSVAGAGDVNGDGLGDFIFGGPGAEPGGLRDAGVAYVYGRAVCPVAVPGDVNASGTVTAADIIALVGYTFKGGPAPLPCAAAGDANCSGSITSADVIALVNFVFKSGAPPCDVCALIPGTWSCP